MSSDSFPNPAIHHRRSIRLAGYDYAQAGLYFVTVCVKDKQCLFGTIENGQMVLNEAGKMVENEWLAMAERFPAIRLEEYILMPNHFHAIVQITEPVGATLVPARLGGVAQAVAHMPVSDFDAPQETNVHVSKQGQPRRGGQAQGIAPTLGSIIGAFKSVTTNEYIRGVKNQDWPPFDGKLWQRNYYEHIISNARSHQQIAEYIATNPGRWEQDALRA